jgi:hypothetical protein
VSFGEDKDTVFLFVDAFPEKLVGEKAFSRSCITDEECEPIGWNATP